MNVFLHRTQFREDGIFGTLFDELDNEIAMTLEHAYPRSDVRGPEFTPKIPPGNYDCIRGNHYLHGMDAAFSTFEVTGVEGHSNLLFHWGNFNNDSEGCILLGENIAEVGQRPQMVTNSRKTFQKFMDLQDGIFLFTLTIW